MRRIYLYNHRKINNSILISGEPFHYLRNVLRLKEGSQFKGFDSTGTEYLLEIKKMQPMIEARILDESQIYQHEPIINIEFCPSLCKMKTFEHTLEKVAELGVAKIKPVITERSFVLSSGHISSKIQRWHKILAEGTKISGSAKIPDICMPERIENVLNQQGINIFFWEQSEKNLKEIIPMIKQRLLDNKTIKVFIGPEGGFTEEEANLAEKTKSLIVGLGKRILSVETATIAAIAILSYELNEA